MYKRLLTNSYRYNKICNSGYRNEISGVQKKKKITIKLDYPDNTYSLKITSTEDEDFQKIFNQCLFQAYNESPPLQQDSTIQEEEEEGCSISFDSLLCWPKTPPGTLAVIPCMEKFQGIPYDPKQNATRFCFGNSTWSTYSDYSSCNHLINDTLDEFSPKEEVPTIIYCLGYFSSLIALLLALVIFISIKDLKCLRNTIHANLFLSNILSALLWILTLFLQLTNETNPTGCNFLVILYHYCTLTNFFWMLVEGLYLYTLVVKTFSSDNIRFGVYLFIGWGCPAIIVIVWSIAKVYTTSSESESFNVLEIHCAWIKESYADWIHKGSVLGVLLLNLIFLIKIMWILITKLRSANNTLETQQYKKASKALLVLIPLFGITYLLVLLGPEHGLEKQIFDVLRIFLLSTQGLCVSLFYCFLNSEVRQALKHKIEMWNDTRNLRSGRKSSIRNRRYKFSKDYSPRSRTESLRLTCSTTNGHQA